MIVVHLIDPDAPDCGRCAMRLVGSLVERSMGERHEVIVLGGRGQARIARSCGVQISGAIPARAGGSTFERAVRSLGAGAGGAGAAGAVVHAWSFRSALLAAAFLEAHPKLATLTAGPPSETGADRLRAARRVRALNLQSVPILACSAAIARAAERAGVRERLLAVVEPPIAPPAHVPARESLRRRWRVPEGAFVVGVLADPAVWSRSRRIVQAIARATVAERDVRLVLPPGLRQATEMCMWFAALSAGRRVILDDEAAAPWMLLPGVDAAFVPETVAIGRAPGILEWSRRVSPERSPVACAIAESWARTIGMPVIVEAAGTGAHALGRPGPVGSVNDIAHRIVELIDSPVRPRLELRADEAHLARWTERYADLHRRVHARELWADAVGGARERESWTA